MSSRGQFEFVSFKQCCNQFSSDLLTFLAIGILIFLKATLSLFFMSSLVVTTILNSSFITYLHRKVDLHQIWRSRWPLYRFSPTYPFWKLIIELSTNQCILVYWSTSCRYQFANVYEYEHFQEMQATVFPENPNKLQCLLFLKKCLQFHNLLRFHPKHLKTILFEKEQLSIRIFS